MSFAAGTLQIACISTSLVAAGGIASLTFFSVPSLQALPASRSLPQIRWLFSRGSHIFPTAAFLTSAGFASLAVTRLPASTGPMLQLLLDLASGRGGIKFNGYIAAAALCLSIGPFTGLMIPTNFELIKRNEEKGGARSEKSAREQASDATKQSRTAEESVSGEGQPGQFTDLSGPQSKSEKDTTEEEDEKVRELLGKFGQLNLARAILIGAGGIAGLATALL